MTSRACLHIMSSTRKKVDCCHLFWRDTTCQFQGIAVPKTIFSCRIQNAFRVSCWLLFVAYSGAIATELGGERRNQIANSAVSAVIPALGAVFAIRQAFRKNQAAGQSFAWITLAAGLASAAVGESVWMFFKIEGHTPSPSAADYFYLAFPLSASAAIIMFSNRKLSRRTQITLGLDSVIVGVSLFTIALLTVIESAPEDASTATKLVALAYPILHVIALTVSVVTLARIRQTPTTMIAAGLACLTIAEWGYTYIPQNLSRYHIVNIVWTAGMVIIMLAAYGTRSVVEDIEGRSPRWMSVLLPYAPLIAVAVMIVTDSSQEIKVELIIPVSIMGIALLARQYVSVSEDRSVLNESVQEAKTDSLTGLANRNDFDRKLALRMGQTGPFTLVLFDLDGFKKVNDSMGHQAGDEILRAVALRLAGCMRSVDLAARLGGDEFAVITDAEVVARRVVDMFTDPFVVAGGRIDVRASVGVVTRAGESSAAQLLKKADTAMYAAKRLGGGGG